MAKSSEINRVRKQIDELDQQIQKLISQRANCARRVAEIKIADNKPLYYRPEREAQVLRAVMARNDDSLKSESMVRIFREIMSACLAVEQPLSVSFLGPEGTFTQEAMLKHFGHAVMGVSQVAVNDIFSDVATGRSVAHTLDMFLNSPLKICGEVELRVHHHLLSQTQTQKELKRIYGHQQALAQCRGWLEANLKGVEQTPVSSNAEAAIRATREAGVAAVASDAAAEIYKLNVLNSNIEDAPDNTKRFLIIGAQSPSSSGDDITSILIMEV